MTCATWIVRSDDPALRCGRSGSASRSAHVDADDVVVERRRVRAGLDVGEPGVHGVQRASTRTTPSSGVCGVVVGVGGDHGHRTGDRPDSRTSATRSASFSTTYERAAAPHEAVGADDVAVELDPVGDRFGPLHRERCRGALPTPSVGSAVCARISRPWPAATMPLLLNPSARTKSPVRVNGTGSPNVPPRQRHPVERRVERVGDVHRPVGDGQVVDDRRVGVGELELVEELAGVGVVRTELAARAAGHEEQSPRSARPSAGPSADGTSVVTSPVLRSARTMVPVASDPA